MADDTYLILRVSGGAAQPADPFDATVKGESVLESTQPLEYRVDTASLGPQGLRDARRDPQVAGIARPMPLKLIQPVATPEPAAAAAHIHDATWGVFVT